MKHVVIGTAGHVDHGKTALVRALTGVDTDRLAEEKRRGLTIELGFARLDFPDGSCAGVVDVPGHEKFIKTMLAGAGGIDLAMLVVAADEGFMPQTVEHLNILSLLGVRRGVVVLTKCDLADADWLAMARAELAARVKGTFLENAPVVETSAATGQGIEDLREMLHALVRQTREKSARVPFRLPIDRVFSVDGFGTVVTGTLIEGALHVGGEAELLPSGTRSRVRNLQVHGENTAIAVAGQRVAVNLAGIKKTDVARGDTLAEPDSVRVSRLLDVRLSCLRDSERTVENGSRVHFCHGTAARLAKVVLLDRDALAPGESAYAQLRFTEDVAAKCGDRFVIRFYSPLETIGGGIILDDAPARHKRNDAAVLSALAVRENGSGAERVLQALTAFDTALPSAAQLAARLGMEETRLAPELDTLLARGDAAAPMADAVISKRHQTAGDARLGHDVAGQNKERNSQQQELCHAAVHVGRDDRQGGTAEEQGENGRHTQADGNGDIQQQHHEETAEQDQVNHTVSLPPSVSAGFTQAALLLITSTRYSIAWSTRKMEPMGSRMVNTHSGQPREKVSLPVLI